MTSDEILKSYMDQLALDQQNFRDDLRAMQRRSDERWDAMQRRLDAMQKRSDERLDKQMDEVKKDVRTTLWSGLTFAAAIFGTITGLLLAFIH